LFAVSRCDLFEFSGEFGVPEDFFGPVLEVSSGVVEHEALWVGGFDSVEEFLEVSGGLACGFSDGFVEVEGFVVSDGSEHVYGLGVNFKILCA